MSEPLPVVQKAQPYLEEPWKVRGKGLWGYYEWDKAGGFNQKPLKLFFEEDLERERLGWEKEITRLTKEKEELKQKIKEQLRELPCLSVIFKTAPACNEKDIPIVCSNCKVRYELLGLSKQ